MFSESPKRFTRWTNAGLNGLVGNIGEDITERIGEGVVRRDDFWGG